MKEYIEREAAIRIIDKYGCGNGSVLGYHSGAVDCAGSEIARIPAADVVEVVRCKDCKYFTEGMAVGMCKRIPDKPIIPMPYTNYCGFGERRE